MEEEIEINSPKQLFELYSKEIKNPEIDNLLEKIPPILAQDLEDEIMVKEILMFCYEDLRSIFETYLDLDEKYIKIISLWVIGTYFHERFNSYPYLFINAMRGSGKSRLLGLISELADQGSMQNSMTEAVLFRTKGSLCIDEFESITRKGFENLRELLNSAYKKGTKVKRMRKTFSKEGEKQVVEEFDVYRPIAMANISGIGDVLGDRCIKMVIEKSINEKKTKLVENYRGLIKIQALKRVLLHLKTIQCSMCNVVAPGELSNIWNSYLLQHTATLTTLSSLETLTTLTTLKNLKKAFDKIQQSEINGRNLELSLPLLNMALWIEGDLFVGLFDEILQIFTEIFEQKKQEETIENLDISLIDFLSQHPESITFLSVKGLTERFREFLQTDEEWINSNWMIRALNRSKVVMMKRRLARGVEVIIDFKKVQEKIKMFR